MKYDVGTGSIIHHNALRILVEMQVALFEHLEEHVTATAAMEKIEKNTKEWLKIVKKLERF